MRKLLNLSLIVITALLLTNCNRVNKQRSTLTGWNYNDPKYGNYIKGKSFEGQKPPIGMVAVEGGTFTMGHVQDDVMFDWNTTPTKMHIRSFYMDEAEVTNSEYVLFLQNMRDVFPPDEEKYKHIYNSVLPDTLVWRRSLGNTDLLSENYLRHPAYADYPVVGVSWIQAVQYCKWRTNAVNLRTLIDRGYIKNIFENDTLRNFFDTDVFLTDAKLLFDGDTTVYKRGIPIKKIRKKGDPKPVKGSFQGRPITSADGVLAQKFRLPTEAEWEYAAKSIVDNREYNNVKGRKKYAWSGKYTRDRTKRYRGDQLANFKQGDGDYSGLAGWSSDGSDIPIKIKSYPANGFGLYDMSGNVAEWVADVYRPIIDAEANDFNYFRGNIFTKKMINKEGKVVIIGDSELAKVTYDTLATGKIVVVNLPGTIKYVPITKNDTYMRRNYSLSNNSNLNDGDHNSSKQYRDEEDQFSKSRMYNSPVKPSVERDSISGNVVKKYDSKRRTTLISNKTRVYKGGSWLDREYWLDPSQRRYLPQYMATNFIGFRCVTDKVGPMTYQKRSAKNLR